MPRIPTIRRSEAAGAYGLLHIPRQILHAIHRRASVRQLRRQPMKLDDRILRDIGLTRAELTDIDDKLRDVRRCRKGH